MTNAIKGVPFVDLTQQYDKLSTEIMSAFDGVCRQGSFILGPQVTTFEENFAGYLGADCCVGVGSGTDALHLAFRALGIGAGDEVIIPAHTFVATAIAVMQVGAKPVLVDIEQRSFLIDVALIEAAITPRTKAICPVHLYGRACNMERIQQIAKRHSLAVVEDAAQAHGARWNERPLGTIGDIGCFSFYPGKNLGAYGDGGAVVTNNDQLASRVRQLRNYGSEVKYHHPIFGFNSRLDSLQAAVLNVKLNHLNAWNTQRHQAARYYSELLEGLSEYGGVLPEVPHSQEHVFHLYVVQLGSRDAVARKLKQVGIQTAIHYPVPFYLQDGYSSLGYTSGTFPITERIASRILSLPLFPEITKAQQEYVARYVLEIAQSE